MPPVTATAALMAGCWSPSQFQFNLECKDGEVVIFGGFCKDGAGPLLVFVPMSDFVVGVEAGGGEVYGSEGSC